MDSVITAWIITFILVVSEILLTIKINKPKMINFNCCDDKGNFCFDMECKVRVKTCDADRDCK